MADYATLLNAEKKRTSSPSTISLEQTQKPANQQAVKPANLQTHLPASPKEVNPSNPFAGKPVKPLARKSENDPVEKYTTRLTPSMVRRIKIHAAQQDMKDYEVVEKALQDYFEKNK